MSTVASTNAFDKNPQSKERGITLDLGRALLLCSTCILMCLHVALFFIILARKRRLSQTVETFSVHGRLDLRFSHLLLEASDLPFSWLIFVPSVHLHVLHDTHAGFSSFMTDVPAHLQSEGHTDLQITLVDCPGHASLIRTIIGGT